jgi:hypothetical protein
MSDVTVENTPPTQPPAGENIINLTDLQNILVVFDLASNRGAFRGNELEPVGQLYNKIAKFVQAAMPAQPPADGQETTQGA